MLAKVTLALSTLAVLVAAGPTGTTTVSQCNSSGSTTKCCEQYLSAADAQAAGLLGPLTANLGSLTGLLGFNCSPLQLVGAGTNCANTAVCCQNNSFNGLVDVGCTPISL